MKLIVTMRRRSLLMKTAMAASTLLVALTTGAQTQQAHQTQQAVASFPNRTLRLISGFAPGGATDVVARVIAQSITEAFGQTVVVENKPGAAGNIGAEFVARSAPDGYTMYLANATIAMPSMFPKIGFDVRKDFAPVSMIAFGPSLLAVNAKLPVRSVKELMDYAARNPGKLDYASGGVGNITHMAVEELVLMTNMKMTHVPYKGGAPSTNAVVGGEVPVLMAAITNTLGHLKSGTLVPLAVTGRERSKALPDVPTMAEAGVPGYEASSWYGIVVAAGTPKPVVDKLNKAIADGLQKKELREKLVQQGMDPAPGTPQEFAAYINSEIDKWAVVISKANITAE